MDIYLGLGEERKGTLGLEVSVSPWGREHPERWGKETHIWILGEQLGRWRLRQGEWKRQEEELLNGEIQKERREM